jgi:hypothetical protein
MRPTVDTYEKQNPKLAELRTRCLALHQAADDLEEDAFHHHLDIGHALVAIKAQLRSDKGAFGKYCNEAFPFSRAWRAKLMYVAEHLHRLQSIAELPHWTIESVYKAIKAHERERAGTTARPKKPSAKEQLKAKDAIIDKLTEELKRARAKIISYEAQLRGRAKRRAA